MTKGKVVERSFRGARAPRTLAKAARLRGLWTREKIRFGGTPKPAGEAPALPGNQPRRSRIKGAKKFTVSRSVDPERSAQPVEIGALALPAAPEPVVLTVGHSTRAIEEFISLLQAHGITLLADVRTVPRSRHNPQFNKTSLPESLGESGIRYVHLPGLGGLRHAKADSPNDGWRNASFRGFADYMQTVEFAQGLEQLIELASHDRVALMCAEAVPWRCHRSLIADALTVRGLSVEDIMSATRRQPHRLTPFARVEKKRITYPAADTDQPELPLKKAEDDRPKKSKDSKAG